MNEAQITKYLISISAQLQRITGIMATLESVNESLSLVASSLDALGVRVANIEAKETIVEKIVEVEKLVEVPAMIPDSMLDELMSLKSKLDAILPAPAVVEPEMPAA